MIKYNIFDNCTWIILNCRYIIYLLNYVIPVSIIGVSSYQINNNNIAWFIIEHNVSSVLPIKQLLLIL